MQELLLIDASNRCEPLKFTSTLGRITLMFLFEAIEVWTLNVLDWHCTLICVVLSGLPF